MSYSITFTGDDEIIRKGVKIYAECHGWTEENDLSFEEYAQQCVKDNIVNKIAEYSAGKAAAEARAKEMKRVKEAFVKGASK